MSAQQKVAAFLGRHGFDAGGPDINTVIQALLYDMEQGLKSDPGELDSMGPSQEMIPVWSLPPEETPRNQSVIVIDAGGTNFRSCLVTFDASGIPSISKLEKRSMPGIERELGRQEFFDTIAEYLDHLKNDSNRIGFCFSYAMKITPEGDGRVVCFSKEIKAKEVIGSLVGESLSQALVKRGWNKPEKITLLNDTTAALLAGASNAVDGRKYGSYVGLILGTGMNAAYIEPGPIAKAGKNNGTQIVVCESGLFNKVPRSTIDLEFDRTTNTPGKYVFEKMCSGGYLGPVARHFLRKAAEDGLFTEPVAKELIALASVELKDMDQFFYGPFRTDTKLGLIASHGTQEDCDTLYALLDALVARSARLTAANIAAVVIKSGKGGNPSLPVSVLCEGTTFYKTHNLHQRLRGYLNEVLTQQRGLYFEIVTLENAITLGAAMAGLI